MKEYIKIAIISFVVSIVTCNFLVENIKTRINDNAYSTKLLEEKTRAMQNIVESMRAEIVNMGITDLQIRYNQLFEQDTYAELSPASPQYRIVRSGFARFPVSLSRVEKYANGYKAYFKIGNPYLTYFQDVRAEIKYGKAWDKKENYEKWDSALKAVQSTKSFNLKAGGWNEAIAILSPAKEEDIEYIRISLDTDIIGFPNQ